MLIDGTYFIGLITIEGMNIPSGAGSVTNDANSYYFNTFLEKYEKEYLVRILGHNMYREFSAYLNREDTVDAVEKWENLKNLLTIKGECPIANYVFFKYVKRNGISVQNSGVVKSQSEDEVNIDSVIIPAWNDMVEMNKEIYVFLEKNKYEGFCFDNFLLKKINWLGV